jgi:hypothetical protein
MPALRGCGPYPYKTRGKSSPENQVKSVGLLETFVRFHKTLSFALNNRFGMIAGGGGETTLFSGRLDC